MALSQQGRVACVEGITQEAVGWECVSHGEGPGEHQVKEHTEQAPLTEKDINYSIL